MLRRLDRAYDLADSTCTCIKPRNFVLGGRPRHRPIEPKRWYSLIMIYPMLSLTANLAPSTSMPPHFVICDLLLHCNHIFCATTDQTMFLEGIQIKTAVRGFSIHVSQHYYARMTWHVCSPFLLLLGGRNENKRTFAKFREGLRAYVKS